MLPLLLCRLPLCCLIGYPRGEVSPWLPHPCHQFTMPPLPASLTDLSSRFLRLLERNTEPRLQSLLCDYTTDFPLPALHEAIRTLGEVTNKAPTHLCDTWR